MDMHVTETRLPDGASDADIQARIDSIMSGYALACIVETRGDGSKWLVRVDADSEMIDAAIADGQTPREKFGAQAQQVLATRNS